MNEIVINGKRFAKRIAKEELAFMIELLAKKLQSHISPEDNPLYVVMLNGAFMFASDFLRMIPRSVETKFVRYTSYQGMSSSETMNKDAILTSSDVRGRVVVVLEDIVDTGRTMNEFVRDVASLGAKEIIVASLFARSRQYDFGPHASLFPAITIDNDAFIVGYGLDFDGEGRNLPDIYENLPEVSNQ